MENASKALIIAGAILISILLISIGILVYNSAQGTVQQATGSMSEQEQNIFNSKFTTYEGNRQSGSTLKSLLNVVKSNNTNLENPHITLAGTSVTDLDATTNINAITVGGNAILTTSTYQITCTLAATGLVQSITITAN